MRIAPYRRPCLSAAFTFMGRSSALPTILKRYKGKQVFWNNNEHGTTFCMVGVLFRQIINNSAKHFTMPGTNIPKTYNLSYENTLCHLVGLFDDLNIDRLTTLDECHCGHQSAHRHFILILDFLSGFQPSLSANSINVPDCVVL